MIITFEGREWQFDEDRITVKQGIAIHLAYGFTVSTWLGALAELDARAVQVTYWLMLQQNGVVQPIADTDCQLVAFMQAYTEARTTSLEEDLVQEAEAAAVQAAVPTSPAPDVAAVSPAPASPPTTTPVQPQQLAVPPWQGTGY